MWRLSMKFSYKAAEDPLCARRAGHLTMTNPETRVVDVAGAETCFEDSENPREKCDLICARKHGHSEIERVGQSAVQKGCLSRVPLVSPRRGRTTATIDRMLR
jgi:hypothetical protein